MANFWFSLQQRERVLDSIDQRPTQVEEVLSGTPRQDDAGHGSAGVASLGELASQVIERDRLTTLEFGQSGLDRRERIGIRKDLCRLLERFVFVDRDEDRRRPSMSIRSITEDGAPALLHGDQVDLRGADEVIFRKPAD